MIFTYLGDFFLKNWFSIGAQVIQKWLKEKYFQDYFHQKKYRDSNKSWKPDGETWDVFIIFMVREGYFRSMYVLKIGIHFQRKIADDVGF